MIREALAAALLALLGSPAGAAPLPSFQALVDATPDGGVLKPAAGVYAGPVVIRRPIAVEGGGALTISGGGLGTVVIVSGRAVTLSGLKIENSGRRHENQDSCLRLENASFDVVKDNVLEGCLVGIDINRSDNNILRRNRVQGTDPDLDMRGDGIRVWWSNGNRIENNTVTDQRDVLFEYSTGNVLSGNTIRNGRYGTHFMYASGNVAKGNVYVNNTVGLFSMYASKLCLVDNRILNSRGASGIGIGLKEAGGLVVENNQILANARGLYIDDAPSDPETPNLFRGNRFAFNAVAVQFHTNFPGNAFERNAFESNYTDVSAQGGVADKTRWRGNRWDAYEGFDRKSRGVGETPFEVWAYADRMWADVPMTAFFRGAPVFEAIDFMARLAPFSPPRLVLRDDEPATRPLAAAPADCGNDHGLLAH